MALTDPQTITIDSTPITLAKTNPGENQTIYQSSDGNLKLTISHQETKSGRTRHLARVDKRVVAADPLTSENEYKSLGFYFVIDEPEFGFSDSDIDDVVQGVFTWAATAMIEDICEGQH